MDITTQVERLEIAVSDTLMLSRRRAQTAGRPKERPLEMKTAMLGLIHEVVLARRPPANIEFAPSGLDGLQRRITLLSCGVEELVRQECREPGTMLEFHTELIDTVVADMGPDAMNALFRVLVDAGTMGRGSIEF